MPEPKRPLFSILLFRKAIKAIPATQVQKVTPESKVFKGLPARTQWPLQRLQILQACSKGNGTAVSAAVPGTDYAPAFAPIVAVTGNKTLALTDKGSLQKCTAAAVVTVPLNSAVAFSIGTELEIVQYSAGAVSVAATGEVIIRSKDSKLTIDGQYSAASLKKDGNR